MSKHGLLFLLNSDPWEWPEDAGETLTHVLTDRHAAESGRAAAAELAGDLVVMNDQLAGILMAILRSPHEPERLRATAAISFGPALEQAHTSEFDDPDDVPITELAFRDIQTSLRDLYRDENVPEEVRRRILEVSVRAPESWHADAIRSAYSSGDKEWVLTAVFAMRWVRGFDAQILEALGTGDLEIHCQAVEAAGNWELDAAWDHVARVVRDATSPKPLLLAAINAAAAIRPAEAPELLADLFESDDEEIAEAADEAIAMAEAVTGEESKEDDEYGEDEAGSTRVN